jgi:hypothetical protein
MLWFSGAFWWQLKQAGHLRFSSGLLTHPTDIFDQPRQMQMTKERNMSLRYFFHHSRFQHALINPDFVSRGRSCGIIRRKRGGDLGGHTASVSSSHLTSRYFESCVCALAQCCVGVSWKLSWNSNLFSTLLDKNSALNAALAILV